MRRNINGKKVVIITGICVAAILGTLSFFYFKGGNFIRKKTSITTNISITKPDNDDLLASYVNETRYIGGIGYPIVYNLPFGHDEYYKTNKQLWEEEMVDIEECVNTAQQFANILFNASYRKVNENQDMFTASLADLMDREFFYEEDEYGNGYDYQSYIELWEKYITDNEIEMESTLLTDTSLVYADGYYTILDLVHVRGILEYEVYSSKDPRLPVTDSKKPIMIDIVMHRNTRIPEKYDVIAFNFTSLEASEEKNGND